MQKNPQSHARGIRQAWRWVFLTLLSCVLTTSAFAERSLTFNSPATVTFDEEQQRLDVASIDHQWRLQLTPKQLLNHSSILQEALYELPEFFDGNVIDDEQSWARIAFDDIGQGHFSGHVFTAGRLYELKYDDRMGGHTLSQISGDTTIEDIPLDPAQTDDPGVTSGAGSPPAADSPAYKSEPGPVAQRAIRIGIVVDSRYNEFHDQRGLAQALGIINGVDGLYQDQLGLAVVVDSFRVYDDASQDPLRSFQGSVDQILEEFRDIRMADAGLPADLALVHLFSGHDDPDKVIGLGWISTACRLDGYDVSMSSPFPYGILLSAHEIAHNLGAEHDDDAACLTDAAITGSEIMHSELSGGTRPIFSSCSIEKMRPAMTAACVTDNIDMSVNLEAIATETPYQVDFTITAVNQDDSRFASQVTSMTDFPSGVQLSTPSAGCTIQDSQLLCQHREVAARSFQSVSVSAGFPTDGDTQALISTELLANDFSDTEQLNNRASIRFDLANSSSTPLSMAAANNDQDQSQLATASSGGGAGDGSIAVGSTGPRSLLAGTLFTALALFRRFVRSSNGQFAPARSGKQIRAKLPEPQ